MFRRTLALALLLLAACGKHASAPDAGLVDGGPPDWLHADGQTLRDGRGRQVLLRGVNARIPVLFDVTFDDGRQPLEAIPDFTASDIAAIRKLGMNVLRVPFDWSGLEPQQGTFSDSFLSKLDSIVSACADARVYCLLDLHQDAYSKEIGEDGAPLWAIDPPPTQLLGGPLTDLQARRTSTQVMDAFQSFFAGKDGLQDAQGAAWAQVAARYANQPYLAGYELFNEPLASTQDLLRYDYKFTDAIRAADPSHLVLCEPPAYRNVVDSWEKLASPFARGNIAYAPHVYTEVFSGAGNNFEIADAGALAPSMTNAAAEAQAFGGPLFVTEWGIDPKAQNALLYVRSEAALQDQAQASAIFWLYEEQSQGGWGLFDEPDGGRVERTAFVDALARPFPQAIAGTISAIAEDADARTLRVEFDGLDSEREDLLAAPDRHFPSGANATCDGASVEAAPVNGGGAVSVLCGGPGHHVLTLAPR